MLLQQSFICLHACWIEFPLDVTLVPYCSGDPSVFGNLPPHPAVTEGVRLALESGGYHGYGHSSGLPEVREAVAKEFSRPGAPLTAQVRVTCICCNKMCMHLCMDEDFGCEG